MVVFTLTMPRRGSWNNKWSGDGDIYATVLPNRKVPQQVIGQSFYYRWDDGWTACVSVEKLDCKEANKIMRQSKGFIGYDWMIRSILKYGEIRSEIE